MSQITYENLLNSYISSFLDLQSWRLTSGQKLINKHLGEEWLFGKLTWTFDPDLIISDGFYIAHQFSNFGELICTKEKTKKFTGIHYTIYRGSPVSAVFGSPANRTIVKTALIGD